MRITPLVVVFAKIYFTRQLCIATKWSTGAVWKHPDFAKTINMISSQNERVVGLIFYGYSDQKPSARALIPIENHLKDFTSITD